ALAQQDRLPALGQRPADDRPFFQSVTEHDSPRAAGAMLVNPRRLPYTTTSFRALPVFTAESHDRGPLPWGWRRCAGARRDELQLFRPRRYGPTAGRLRSGGIAAARCRRPHARRGHARLPDAPPRRPCPRIPDVRPVVVDVRAEAGPAAADGRGQHGHLAVPPGPVGQLVWRGAAATLSACRAAPGPAVGACSFRWALAAHATATALPFRPRAGAARRVRRASRRVHRRHGPLARDRRAGPRRRAPGPRLGVQRHDPPEIS